MMAKNLPDVQLNRTLVQGDMRHPIGMYCMIAILLLLNEDEVLSIKFSTEFNNS